jgi:hypothetical protein
MTLWYIPSCLNSPSCENGWSLRDFFVDAAVTLRCGARNRISKEKPVMRKLFLICIALCFVLGLTALAFDDMGKSATVNGWIVDAKCGVKGANAGGEACTKKCAAAGEKMVLVTDGDSKVLAIDNQDAIKGHEGHHVAVTGSVSKDSIHVQNLKML